MFLRPDWVLAAEINARVLHATFNVPTDVAFILRLGELERAGRDHLAVQPTAVDDAAAAVGPERPATIMYTSGTTTCSICGCR